MEHTPQAQKYIDALQNEGCAVVAIQENLHPEEVEVTQTVEDLGVLITLKVNKEDMGKIIGKAGQTAKSLRVLLRMMGAKLDARYNLKIIEPEGQPM